MEPATIQPPMNDNVEIDRTLVVDQRETIEPDDFLRNYIKKNRPLKITKMMDNWPAMKKWSFEFFRGMDSAEEIHLELGNIMQENTEFRKATFQDYVKALIDSDDDSREKAYLSVFRIFDHFPELLKDVDFSLLNRHKLKASVSGWLGPKGTVTGYHVDWGDNILAQISGRKRVHLAAPSDTQYMYVSKKFDQGTLISQVDLLKVDDSKYPLFAKVRHADITLHPGEMIFIPRGWWHHVQSLDKSISVSNITYDFKGVLVDALPHRIKQRLHDIGLWKCECTCHVIRDGKWVRK